MDNTASIKFQTQKIEFKMLSLPILELTFAINYLNSRFRE